MKKLFLLPILLMVMMFSLNLINATSGAIWTTREGCDIPQDENHYNLGEHIWIRGDDFSPGEYDWEIKGQPGQASCDPNLVVESGSYTVDSTGSFCFDAYVVEDDDCGVYKTYFNGKQDNYHVVPEFGLFIGALTLMSAVGVFFLVRKQ